MVEKRQQNTVVCSEIVNFIIYILKDIHDNGIFRYTPKEYSRQYGFEPTESTCKRAVDRKSSQKLARAKNRSF